MLDISGQSISELNRVVCDEYGHTHGVREKHLLASLIDSANQEVFGQELYPTPKDKIAFIVSSLAKNHIFIDGNKRTASIVYLYLCRELKVKPLVSSLV